MDKSIEPKTADDTIYDLEPAENKLHKIEHKMTKLFYKCLKVFLFKILHLLMKYTFNMCLKHGGCGAGNLAGFYGSGFAYGIPSYGFGLPSYGFGTGLYDGFGSFGGLYSGLAWPSLYSGGLYGGGLYGGSSLGTGLGSYGSYGGYPTYGLGSGGLGGFPSAGLGGYGAGPTFYSGDSSAGDIAGGDTDSITVYAADA